MKIVLLPSQDEVLMIQEAKRECRGTWYLPAGRMEPGETIVEAMQREVKEEAGLLCEPVTLLSVEERGASWIRFVFLARPTGTTHLVVLKQLSQSPLSLAGPAVGFCTLPLTYSSFGVSLWGVWIAISSLKLNASHIGPLSIPQISPRWNSQDFQGC